MGLRTMKIKLKKKKKKRDALSRTRGCWFRKTKDSVVRGPKDLNKQTKKKLWSMCGHHIVIRWP